MQMLQNPAMQEMARSLMSNPAVMQQMMDSNPMLRSMTQANPQVLGFRGGLQGPGLKRGFRD